MMENAATINWKTLIVIPAHGEFSHVGQNVYVPNTSAGAYMARGQTLNRVVLVGVSQDDLCEDVKNMINSGTATHKSIYGTAVEVEQR